MKTIKNISVLILFFLSVPFCQAFENDSTKVYPKDSLQNQQKKSKGLDLVLICGLGMTTGSTWQDWNSTFTNGPTICLGLEVLFTKAHIFSILAYGHYWATLTKPNQINDYNKSYFNQFIKLSENKFSQYGISLVAKCYFISLAKSKVRINLHGGFLLLSSDRTYSGFDLGLGLNYQLTENFNLSLSESFLINYNGAMSVYAETTPNLLLLNLNYKFRLIGQN